MLEFETPIDRLLAAAATKQSRERDEAQIAVVPLPIEITVDLAATQVDSMRLGRLRR